MSEMSAATQFHVVNPEPEDPLTWVHQTRRAAVVSRSSPASREYALRLAVSVVRTTGQALAIVDAPALHHHLCVELARHGVATDVRLVHPRTLSEGGTSVRDCLLLANSAVFSSYAPEGRSLPDLLHEAESALVALRPRDLTEGVRRAVGENVIDLDSQPPSSALGAGLQS
jgi:hypothetical protein